MKGSWEKRITDLTNQRVAVLSAFSTDHDLLDREENSQYSGLESAMAALTDMPFLSPPTVQLSFGRVSLDTDPNSISVKFKFWSGVDVGLTASQTPTSSGVATFIQLASAYQIGVASITKRTRNGVTTGFTPVVRDITRDPTTGVPLP